MQINNPLQINDWEIKKFLKAILAIQLTMWGVIGLDAVGFQIPIIRQLIAFIYLSFIPGILLLRILKLHKLGNIETLLYTVGLSIATLMFTGLFMNTIYPLFGISGPISTAPLIIMLSTVVLVLCVLSYERDKDFSDPDFIDVGEILSPPALFLCVIPFLAILGTYLVNFYQNNIILMFLIIIIALLALLIGFDKFIPKNLYPVAVFVIAISLLFHNSLIAMYLWGPDIFLEHYLSSLVITNSFLDLTIPSNVTAMLSITMLAPIFSDLCGMSLTWVYKIIYPLLFSLVPFGLYRVFQKQTDDKIAFLSCFFFVAISVFFDTMLALARQEIAELFLVLLILVMIDKNMNKIKRSFLFIVFGFSLVVSHYGISYIYMLCLISAWLILVLMDNLAAQKMRHNIYSKFGKSKKEKLPGNSISSNIEHKTITSTFVFLFIVFALAWYMYASSSCSPFDTIVHIGDQIASSIFTDLLNPEAAGGLATLQQKTVSPLHDVLKYLHLVSQFFIAIGIFTLILKRKEMEFEDEYTAFSVMTFVLCLTSITVPHFTALSTSRLYHILTIFLAPFCVIGVITLFKVGSWVVRAPWSDQKERSSLKILSVFLVIFLLFNTNFIYEIADDNPRSMALSSDKPAMAQRIINEQDMTSAEWLSVHKKKSTHLHSLYSGSTSLLYGYGFIPRDLISPIGDYKKIKDDTYIFLDYANVVLDIGYNIKDQSIICSLHNTTFFHRIHNYKNKIYDNECNIYV